MGLIRHRKRRSSKARLDLKAKVVQTRNVDLFRDFKCNPTCLVTVCSSSSGRTTKLRSGRTRWNETLKLKLPTSPQSEWVRIVIYDALPTSPALSETDSEVSCCDEISSNSGASGSTSGPPRNEHQANATHHSRRNSTQNSYLYVGEIKLSLLELFKKKDTVSSYRFSLDPAWYNIYDRRLQRQSKEKSDSLYVVGELQLAFKLSTNSKHSTLMQVYNQWRNSLKATLNHRRAIRKANSSKSSLPKSMSTSTKADNTDNSSDVFNSKEDDDDQESRLDYFDSGLDGQDEFTSENNLLSDDISLGSDPMSLEVEDEDLVDKDLASMLPVLDEYEVVGPEMISNFSRMSLTDGYQEELDEEDDDDEDEHEDDDEATAIAEPHLENIYDELHSPEFDDNLDDEDDIDEAEEDKTDNFTVRNTGNRLRRLRRTRRNQKILSNHISPTNNYKLSKKQHAAGVVFMELKNIKDLPMLKNKLSRRKYDMDPFIIATFGRRVFKTSWKKQTLNPVYNECAAFEVFPEETNFEFHFKVLDKDSFSANDKIAGCNLSWTEMVSKQTPEGEWAMYNLPLLLTVEPRDSVVPVLSLRIKYVPYAVLKNFFWQNALAMQTSRNDFNLVDLTLYLDMLGHFTVEEVCGFFTHFNRQPWRCDYLNKDQLIEYLQTWKKSSHFKNVWKCPSCSRSCKPTRNTMNSKLVLENDLITHFAVCSYGGSCKILKPSYVSTDFASKRWLSKVLIKMTYGKYALGSNNANILVQDRDSGIILEEKISAHVKLGMRIIYNGKGKESKKFRSLLKTLSVRQGKKFDDPSSVRQILPFIKFHSLNMEEYEDVPYKTFNDFFYRRIKPGLRKPEGDSKIFVSPADSRCTVFSSIHQAKDIWIKGSRFTLARLTKNYKSEIFNDRSCNILIFRLAPQDYHRFHCPCDAVIGKPIFVDGQYYTVNPMAIRSSLDVFGENVRMIIPLESPEFGTLLLIPIGAMMVGSIILDRKEGDFVKRGEELGYFKFGGSTVVLVVPSKALTLDADLSKNSADGIETLVKVGMSVGHSPRVSEHKREKIKILNPAERERIKRTISISQENANSLNNSTWEYHALKNMLTSEYGEEGVESLARGDTPPSDMLTRYSSSTSSTSAETP